MFVRNGEKLGSVLVDADPSKPKQRRSTSKAKSDDAGSDTAPADDAPSTDEGQSDTAPPADEQTPADEPAPQPEPAPAKATKATGLRSALDKPK